MWKYLIIVSFLFNVRLFAMWKHKLSIMGLLFNVQLLAMWKDFQASFECKNFCNMKAWIVRIRLQCCNVKAFIVIRLLFNVSQASHNECESIYWQASFQCQASCRMWKHLYCLASFRCLASSNVEAFILLVRLFGIWKHLLSKSILSGFLQCQNIYWQASLQCQGSCNVKAFIVRLASCIVK